MVIAPSRWESVLPPGALEATTAASSWPFGRTDPALHVVLNPRAVKGDLGTVLAHEFVHVQTRNVDWAPAWVREGIAEYMAVPRDTLRQRAADVRGSGMPAGLPTDADVDGAISTGPYALSGFAITVLADRLGWPAARGWIAARVAGDTSGDPLLAEWYLDELARV